MTDQEKFDVVLEVRVIKEELKFMNKSIEEHHETYLERNETLLNLIRPLKDGFNLLSTKIMVMDKTCAERGMMHLNYQEFIKDYKEAKKETNKNILASRLAIGGWIATLIIQIGILFIKKI